ncbi:Ig-like domain-containing protein, partial [Vibrio sp. RC27]
MGIGTLFTLANVAADQIVVIDKLGNVSIVDSSSDMAEGVVVLEHDQITTINDESEFSAKQIIDGQPVDVTADVNNIISQIEAGLDPTALGDEFATAAGGTSGSSITSAYTVEFSGSETIAQTQFDTVSSFATQLSEEQVSSLGNFATEVIAESVKDAVLPVVNITIDPITDDDIINGTEADGTVTITGSVGGDASLGDIVTLEVNGTEYTGDVIDDGAGNLVYSIPVAGSDLALDNSVTASVSGTDDAGNAYEATNTAGYSVDTDVAATISVDPITGDDIINGTEADGTVTITGSVGGDASLGDIVTLEVNGTEYTGDVIDDGAGNLVYSIPVAGSDLALDNSVTASVSGTDDAGNAYEATNTAGYSVDTDVAATISVDPITDDDIINGTEADGTVTITGSVGGDASLGDIVTLEVNGTEYTGDVIDDGAGNLVYSIPVAGSDLALDNSVTASVSGTDDAGNTYEAGETAGYSVDTDATATISIDPITEDDIINGTEADGTVTITGSVGGDASLGDIVTLEVNGTEYTGDVIDDGAGNLVYSIPVAGSDLALDNSVTASVSGTDDAGNTYDAGETAGYSVDTDATATISVDPITDDDIINGTEADGTVTITGSVGGDASLGDIVTLEVNGTEYTGDVI